MKAVVRERFGSPEVIEIQEIEKPQLTADDQVLVRVHAAALNPADWYSMTGRPYIGRSSMGLLKPKTPELGSDFAGRVEAVGSQVRDFRPGDEVFGMPSGALGEYVKISAKRLAPKPVNLTYEQAAAVPVAGLTALQALRTHGNVQPAQKVLINGASGGVGTFAVQIAKALGADVTAVCSSRNVELVRSLGADRVIDYTKEDFTMSGIRHDLMIDNVSSKRFSRYRRVLTPDATVVLVGGPRKNRLLGPLSMVLPAMVAARWKSQKVSFFIAKADKDDYMVLKDLIESGKVTPVMDRSFELSQARDAFRYINDGRLQGKVTVTVP